MPESALESHAVVAVPVAGRSPLPKPSKAGREPLLWSGSEASTGSQSCALQVEGAPPMGFPVLQSRPFTLRLWGWVLEHLWPQASPPMGSLQRVAAGVLSCLSALAMGHSGWCSVLPSVAITGKAKSSPSLGHIADSLTNT